MDRESDKDDEMESYRDMNDRVERDIGKCATEYPRDTNDRVKRHKDKCATENPHDTKDVKRDKEKHITEIYRAKIKIGNHKDLIKLRVSDDVRRNEEKRKTEKYRDATIKIKNRKDLNKFCIKDDTVEQEKETRDTEKYRDVELTVLNPENSNKASVKGDSVKREKVLRSAQSADITKLKKTDNNKSEIDYSTERDKSSKRIIPSVRIKKIIDEVDEISCEDQQKKKSIGSAYVDIKIGQKSVKALLDTGAEISAMTKTLFDSLIEIKAIIGLYRFENSH